MKAQKPQHIKFDENCNMLINVFFLGGGSHVRLYICFIKASVAFSTEANCIPAVRILHTIPCRSEGVLRDADLQ